jgi:dTDP-4-dehydrorhamnose reductase
MNQANKNSGASYLIGASGVIGSALYGKLRAAGRRTVGTRNAAGNPELLPLDLRRDDPAAFARQVRAQDTVYLLAAYSNPSWIHEHREEAIALNRDGTKRLIDALRPVQPHLVFMSSVEVFDGVKGAYAEGDAPHPLNFYGQLKFEIEQHLRASYPRSTIVRTGWNVGTDAASRCVVRLTYETLLKPGARMAEDNVFSIIDAADTAEGLLRLAGADDVRDIHFAADTPLHRTELAHLVQTHSRRGAEMGFVPCRFADIAYSEPRGRLNDLDNRYSKQRFGMSYRAMADVVRAKVTILDRI